MIYTVQKSRNLCRTFGTRFSINIRAVYSYLFAPPPWGGGIEKNILQLGKGKNDLTSILTYIMTFVIEFQGHFMIYPFNFVLTDHFLEYYL